MEPLFLSAAGFGGSLLVGQFVLGLTGFGSDHDTDSDAGADHDVDADHDVGADHDAGGDHDAGVDHDTGHGGHGGAWFLGLFTFRSVTAAVTFFGLTGMAGLANGLTPPVAASVALLAGAAVMWMVAGVMKLIRRAKHDGTVRLIHAVGGPATVYLRVPGNNAGPGKVTVAVQGRTVECEAFTEAAELPTGATVRVVRVVGPNAVQVEAAA